MNIRKRWHRKILSEKYSERKTEYIIPTFETYFGFVLCIIFIGVVSDALENIVQPDIVTEIEKYTRDGDRYPRRKADVESVRLFTNVFLNEFGKCYATSLVPETTYFRSSEYGKTVRIFFDDVVAVDDGKVDAMDI